MGQHRNTSFWTFNAPQLTWLTWQNKETNWSITAFHGSLCLPSISFDGPDKPKSRSGVTRSIQNKQQPVTQQQGRPSVLFVMMGSSRFEGWQYHDKAFRQLSPQGPLTSQDMIDHGRWTNMWVTLARSQTLGPFWQRGNKQPTLWFDWFGEAWQVSVNQYTYASRKHNTSNTSKSRQTLKTAHMLLRN